MVHWMYACVRECAHVCVHVYVVWGHVRACARVCLGHSWAVVKAP
jgi:hypothetical protein